MAGKIRHFLERDGRYFARLVIPQRLRPFLGSKTELREALGPDRRIALQKLSAAVADLQDQIDRARLRANTSDASHAAIESVVQRPLSDQQLALRHYHQRVAQDIAARHAHPMWAKTPINDHYTAELRKGLSGQLYDDELDGLVGRLISEARQRGHTTWVKGDAGWRGLAINLCAAEYEALERACEKDDGDFSGVPAHPVLVGAIEEAVTEAKSVARAIEAPAPDAKARAPVSLQGLFDQYFVAQKKLGIGREAERRWKSSFKHLIKFLGHDDAARLTKKDVMRWRDNRLIDVSPKTVADVDLAGLRAILKWAVEEDYLEFSAASGVRQKVQRRVLNREKGYTADEAVNVLQLSFDYIPVQTGNSRTTETPQTTNAKNWIPLICALTGARVTEISQLRTQDFRHENGVHVFRITPDAGSVKTGEYRDVPIHRQLLDKGLWEYAKSCDGPLFYTNTPGRDKLKAARMVSGRVSGWLTKSGLVPAEIDPNHGWRHRFTTVAREAGVSDRVIDAIAGHAGRTAGERYGDVTLKTLHDAILVYDWSRLSRDTGSFEDIAAKFPDPDRIISVLQGSTLVEAVAAGQLAYGQKMSEANRKATIEGMAKKRGLGAVHGNPGIRDVQPDATAVASENSNARIRQIADVLIEHGPVFLTRKHVAEILNDQGILTGQDLPWTISRVTDPLQKARALIKEEKRKAELGPYASDPNFGLF